MIELARSAGDILHVRTKDESYGRCQCGCGMLTTIAARTDRRKGYIKGQPTKYVHGHSRKGKACSPEHREKISRGTTGHQKSRQHREALSLSLKGKGKGETNPGWKGEDAGYIAIHEWVRRNKTRTGRCSNCGKSGRTEWSNVAHSYRRELADYGELCHQCHHRYDVTNGLILPLHQRR